MLLMGTCGTVMGTSGFFSPLRMRRAWSLCRKNQPPSQSLEKDKKIDYSTSSQPSFTAGEEGEAGLDY